MMNPIIHFEIPANDPERAKKFYEKIFKWKIDYSKEYDYYMISAKTKYESKEIGIDGGMMKRKMPDQPFTCYIMVDSIDKSLKEITSHGGSVVLEKHPIGEMGAIAAFKDPEGNIVGLHEMGEKKMQM